MCVYNYSIINFFHTLVTLKLQLIDSMRIFSVVKAILLLHVSYVSLSSARLEASALAIEAPPPVAKQCGFRNGHNICYMNALLAALYDVTPFRQV
jgi:hypothetical protein